MTQRQSLELELSHLTRVARERLAQAQQARTLPERAEHLAELRRVEARVAEIQAALEAA